MPRPYRRRKLTEFSPDADPMTAVLDHPEGNEEGRADDEEVVLARPSRQARVEALEIEARVVYLGRHPKKSVIFEGAVMSEGAEPGRMRYTPGFDRDTHESYDFTAPERRLPDGRFWCLCRHIRHLAWFYEAEDKDHQPEFEIRGTPGVIEQIRAYIARAREVEARNTDEGIGALRAMGLAD